MGISGKKVGTRALVKLPFQEFEEKVPLAELGL